MQKILSVGIGGFIGACLRYLISSQLSKFTIAPLPLGTLLVNVLGGLFIGLIMELSIATDLVPPSLRLFLVTGILGGLTTFSTFSYETVTLMSEGSLFFGILNIGLNLFLSLAGAAAGIFAVRAFI